MTPDRPPNIIFLFPDQWRGDCLSHLGHPDVWTPWADQLATEGTTYLRAFSPATTCIPARMCLLTGMSPWANGRTGYEENVPWTPPHTLPGLLADAGYQTIQVGKTHFAPMAAHLGFQTNITYEASVREPGFVSDYHRELRANLPLVEDAALRRHPNSWTVTPWCAQREWHCTEWITRQAIEELESRDPDRPFFLQVGWHRPHPPFDPPLDLWQRWRDRDVRPPAVGDWVEDVAPRTAATTGMGGGNRLALPQALEARRAYYAGIEHVDEQVGRLWWALRRLGLDRNTWVVLTSDHGEFLGDHHRWHKSLPNAACARIPLIVRPPGHVKTARDAVDDRPCTLTELMPTALHWAGVAVPERCDAPRLDDERTFVHEEHHSFREGHHALYDERWAYHWHVDGTERLFDHTDDPLELHECGVDHPDELARWRERLIQHLAHRGCGASDGTRLIPGTIIGPTQERSWA